nr:MAG TPA: hypothetical protein [Caudoviricetes sp.]
MEQTHIKSFGLQLVLARHVIIPRDLLSFGEKSTGQFHKTQVPTLLDRLTLSIPP